MYIVKDLEIANKKIDREFSYTTKCEKELFDLYTVDSNKDSLVYALIARLCVAETRLKSLVNGG